MKNELTFHVESDDGAFELFVSLRIGAFSGESSAWFSREQMEVFINRLSQYPLDESSLPLLTGGFLDHEGKNVTQEHVCISIRPIGNRGALGLRVLLAKPGDSDARAEAKYSVSASIDTTYEKASELRKGLWSLVNEDFPGKAFVFCPEP